MENQENVDPSGSYPHTPSDSPAVTPLRTTTSSRLNVLANRQPHPPSTLDSVDPMLWDIPFRRVVNWYTSQPRNEDDILEALRSPHAGHREFVYTLLDFLEPFVHKAGTVSWPSRLVKTLVCDFGWQIVHVWSRDDQCQPIDITIQRPSRVEERRAKARTQARRARGIMESPLPRTFLEQQMQYFLEVADEELVAEALRIDNEPLALKVLLEHLVPVCATNLMPDSSPVVRILVEQFHWGICGGRVYSNESNTAFSVMVQIQPRPKPKKRRRAADEPREAPRVPLGELRLN